jgi:hypothetical protein
MPSLTSLAVEALAGAHPRLVDVAVHQEEELELLLRGTREQDSQPVEHLVEREPEVALGVEDSEHALKEVHILAVPRAHHGLPARGVASVNSVTIPQARPHADERIGYAP